MLTPDAYIITLFAGHDSGHCLAEHVGREIKDRLPDTISDWWSAHQFYSRAAGLEN